MHQGLLSDLDAAIIFKKQISKSTGGILIAQVSPLSCQQSCICRVRDEQTGTTLLARPGDTAKSSLCLDAAAKVGSKSLLLAWIPPARQLASPGKQLRIVVLHESFQHMIKARIVIGGVRRIEVDKVHIFLVKWTTSL
jgi:hypothetical protein